MINPNYLAYVSILKAIKPINPIKRIRSFNLILSTIEHRKWYAMAYLRNINLAK